LIKWYGVFQVQAGNKPFVSYVLRLAECCAIPPKKSGTDESYEFRRIHTKWCNSSSQWHYRLPL